MGDLPWVKYSAPSNGPWVKYGQKSYPQAPSGSTPAEITAGDGTRMVLDPQTGSYTNAELMAGNMQPGVGESLLAGAANGATFGWGDEIAGAMGMAPIDVERGRATQLAAQQQHPVASIGGNMAGGIAMVAPALAAAPAVLTGGSMLGQTVAGAGTGAALGALQGAGDANGGDRVRGAVTGGLVGTAAGAASPYIAAGAKAGIGAILTRLKGVDISGIRAALGISSDAAKIIKAHLANDDPAAAAAALTKAGPQGMLADSSQQAAQLLDTTVAAGGPAGRIATDAVEGRAKDAATRLTVAMDNVLGGAPAGVKSAARDIAARTAASRQAAYDAAYAAPIDYADSSGSAIEDVLNRIPPKTVNAAVQEANDAMRAAGVKNQQIMAQVAQNGDVVFQEMPNVQQLDFLKRALGSIADSAKDTFGRYTSEGLRANMLARDLKDAIAAAVPEYGRAVKLGGDKIAEDRALDLGRKLLSATVTRETVKETMAGASVEARQAAKQGLRTAFDEAMANVKAIASNPGETDARAALKAVKDFSSEANRAKAAMILGKAQSDQLFATFDQAAVQLALKASIATNSKTAARLAGKAAMDAIQSGFINDLKTGNPAAAARRVVQIFTNSTPAAQTAKQQTVYAEVAKALTQLRGAQAQAALQIVQRAISGVPTTKAQAQIVAKAITLLGAAGAYQSGRRSLTSPAGGPP